MQRENTQMKELCQKCHFSGAEIMLTEIVKNDIGIFEISLRDICRK